MHSTPRIITRHESRPSRTTLIVLPGMPAYSIVDWLSSIPSHRATRDSSPSDASIVAVRSRKRRRLDPPTPEQSHYTNDYLSTAGRRKLTVSSYSSNTSPTKRVVPFNDDTPRPQRRKRVQTRRSESSYSLSSSHSNRAGRQSPQEYLNFLECSDRGVRINELSALHRKPPALQDLLDTMERISSGGGIVATSAQGSLSTDDNFRWYRHAWHFSDERDLVGPTPSPKGVLRILAAAAECSSNGHSEAGWNILVHQRVLELALQSPDQEEFTHHINFLMSSTASIIPEYVATTTPLRKIDFCIYIDPAFDQSSAGSTLQSVLTSIRGNLPGAVLNHTDYRPLRERPIALSIETKKTGEGWDGATLQLGVWQSAQWSFLRQLVEGQRRRKLAEEVARRAALVEEGARSVQQSGQGVVEGLDGDAHPTETSSLPEIDVQPCPLPEFIPGIIVQGHDWHLVITTTDGQQTQLWQKVTIGTTNTTKGIYQIVYALQVLRQWALDVYWPWLRALLLAF
ncbi:hypothetical protein AK830_g4267 [Neonectria ditissima]|uniref:PD-(D/E)XK nuclease-like domain-containing protein n=1 Tax=Neonectria ditissima TaxID=78410 RepID=A0A0P7BGD7_9HYPO|nr:hypothetical protein AK830_g4267 [Neonectria ditissima]